MKKLTVYLKHGIFSAQRVLIYHKFKESLLSSFIWLVFPHVANFRYVENFRFLTLKSDFQEPEK